ncbi:UNVERIFIED_CONTAM: hypothetical protein HDU68_008875 [Siphonaria sp. JEL0065]|nr:hypothetical protein HDU68_008875 [Siphonaria sp. JEL0065]
MTRNTNTKLHCSGFSDRMRARDLAYEFARFGKIVRCDIPVPKNPSSDPFAFIEFEDARDVGVWSCLPLPLFFITEYLSTLHARQAKDAYHEMHGYRLDGFALRIDWAWSRAPSRRPLNQRTLTKLEFPHSKTDSLDSPQPQPQASSINPSKKKNRTESPKPASVIASKTLVSLPLEIIQNILIYVPIDSSIKTLCLTSKIFCSLLTDSTFASHHMDNARKQTNPLEIAQGANLPAVYMAIGYLEAIMYRSIPSVWVSLEKDLSACSLKIISEYVILHIPPSFQSDSVLEVAVNGLWPVVLHILFSLERLNPQDSRFCLDSLKMMEARFKRDTGISRAFEFLLKDGRLDCITRQDTSAPLIRACVMGQVETVRLLLSHPKVDPSASEDLALRCAVCKGHVEVVRILLQDARVSPATCNNEAVKSASQFGFASVLDVLLKDGRTDPAASNNSALCEAVRLGHVACVTLLLGDERVDPLDNACLPIRYAVHDKRVEIIDLLMKHPRMNPEIVI